MHGRIEGKKTNRTGRVLNAKEWAAHRRDKELRELDHLMRQAPRSR